MFFLARTKAHDLAVDMIEGVLVSLGMSVLGWRVVPVDGSVLGPLAAASQPAIRQLFIGPPPRATANAQVWERRALPARRLIERKAAQAATVSCSSARSRAAPSST